MKYIENSRLTDIICVKPPDNTVSDYCFEDKKGHSLFFPDISKSEN